MSDASESNERNEENVRFLDVRPILEAGGSPFPVIMAEVEKLEPGEALRLRAPFEPVPLYSVMGGRGFVRSPRQLTGEDGTAYWEVLFSPLEEAADFAGGADEDDDGPMELDVRGLDPPEPMERVLATLEGLRYDDVLLVRHHREPQPLYPILAERGYSHRAEEDGSGEWRIRIWRNR